MILSEGTHTEYPVQKRRPSEYNALGEFYNVKIGAMLLLLCSLLYELDFYPASSMNSMLDILH